MFHRKWMLALGIGALCMGLHADEKSDEKAYYDSVDMGGVKDGAVVNATANFLEAATSERIEKYHKDQPLNRTYAVFPETRFNVIVTKGIIPHKWLEMAPKERENFADVVRPGEYYVFQVGLYAMRQDLLDVNIKLSELNNESEGVIPMSASECLNTQGVDFTGKPYTTTLHVPQDNVQPLWILVKIPDNAKGTYTGKLWISPRNAKESVINVKFEVKGDKIADHGLDRDDALGRLHWLNSSLGIDDQVTKGFTPIAFDPSGIKLLGRQLQLADIGLFKSFKSFFTGANDKIKGAGKEVLAKPMEFIVEFADGTTESFKLKEGPAMYDVTPSRINWECELVGKQMTLRTEGWLEFDGYSEVKLTLDADKSVSVKNIRLVTHFTPAMSKYMIGLDREGGIMPEKYDWKWDVNNRGQDGAWIGNVNGGVRCSFSSVESHPSLVNIYYPFSPLRTPQCWANFGKGGITVAKNDAGVTLTAYTGPRTFTAGESETFVANFIFTPFKLLNKDVIYGDRILHGSIGGGISKEGLFKTMKEQGTNTAIFHHSNNAINPWINYPFRSDNVAIAKDWFDDAHKLGYRMKIYYTARELSTRAAEFPALMSLGSEIISAGPGKDARTVVNSKGPNKWLNENLKTNFIPAWNSKVKVGPHKGATDISVIVAPQTRLDNFYIAGLDYYITRTGVDGLYIDDSSLDRITFRRARKLLDARSDNARIDIHSWNHFNGLAGKNTCLYMYMPILPYVDLTWLGEGRNYNKSPEYLLVESTGIPFGLPGQMLEGGGHPWRGMIYNMTARAGWGAKQNPLHMWKFWDDFGLKDCDMVGFWDDECPVTVDNDKVRATVYQGKGKAAIAVASWDNNNDIPVNFKIDWKKLGLDPAKVKFDIPHIQGYFQEPQSFDPAKPLTIPKGKGFIITIKE